MQDNVGDRLSIDLTRTDIVDPVGLHDTVHAVASRAEHTATGRVSTLTQQPHQQ